MKTESVANQNQEWLDDAVTDACERIAPVWPLDKSIAVNPWWMMRNQSMTEVAAKLKSLGNIHMLMDKAYYKKLWQSEIQQSHLIQAADALGVKTDVSSLVAYLDADEQKIYWHHLSELLDHQTATISKVPWRDEIVQQISQFCALYFQYPERMKYKDDTENGFYKMWLEVVSQDRGLGVVMKAPGLHKKFNALPTDIDELFSLAQQTFGGADKNSFTDYCHALLLDINGWASWMANISWQAAFTEDTSNLIKQLLATRLAWNLVLWQHEENKSPENFSLISQRFIQQLHSIQVTQEQILADQQYLWVWHRALEFSYQQDLHSSLLENLHTLNDDTAKTQKELHAIFCIDVRSEPIRRALEAQSPSIKTSGFAGFFGLPIEYTVKNSHFSRPQLPGLLSPSVTVEQGETPSKYKEHIFRNVAIKKSTSAPPSAFGIVEAKGLSKVIDLVKNNFFPRHKPLGIASLNTDEKWTVSRKNKALNDTEIAELLVGVIDGMQLRDNFSKRILLVGHSSCTTNNPHAAGLDCGACGGQSGEVNVKVLAQLLNTETVRDALHAHDISIPSTTTFVACLHNTTTDDITFFDPDNAFATEAWTAHLLAATELAQKNRSSSVNIIDTKKSSKIKKQFNLKASSWSEIRPEWGLANNAAFIVAPRALSQGINLNGRSFLHDYAWQNDKGFAVLESIITAPMVVTNWINLQYYASTTDNKKYGSGNKLLHNVVGGNIGVFEGNGGDLRIGLSMQSINDSKEWRHQALRLNVYYAAPREAIAEIVSRHQHIKDLINNDWLYLFQIDEDSQQIWQLKHNQWTVVS